jgi:hypothetical protein
MTTAAEITRRLDDDGYVVLPQRIGGEELAAAREEIAVLLAAAGWGSGFDGSRTRRVWAPLARTRCMDRAALHPVVLDAAEQTIGPPVTPTRTNAFKLGVRLPYSFRSTPLRARLSRGRLHRSGRRPSGSACRKSSSSSRHAFTAPSQVRRMSAHPGTRGRK